MYGWFDPLVIYGFQELDGDSEISESYFQQKFPDSIDEFTIEASSLVRSQICKAVYGVHVVFTSGGVSKVTKKQKQLVQRIYNEVSKTKKYGAIGFHLAIRGDYQSEHVHYNPDELAVLAKDEEEEEEEPVIKATRKRKRVKTSRLVF